MPGRRLAALLPLALLSLSLVVGSSPTADAADDADAVSQRPVQREITYTQWDSAKRLQTGELDGLVVRGGRLVFAKAQGTRAFGGTTYDRASWLSPWVDPGHSFTQLIGSWSATTPGDSWLEVSVRGVTAGGRHSSWFVLGRWTSGDAYLERQTLDGQDGDLARVDTDTLTAPHGLAGYQLKATLLRRHGSAAAPSLDTIGAVASLLPAAAGRTSKPGVARGVVLDVPRYSQMIHRGEYPRWNGGGEAWCSPTSTSMVLGYYGALPSRRSYRWVDPSYPDRWVDAAARGTFDYVYSGTGNWPFNTAYAAPLAGHAFVTRLRSLHEAERFVAAGIPLVASISFGSGELSGAPISSTNGHLVVISGFTQDGDVVVNDPAGATDAAVVHTYDRGQFERAWLDGSGGTVYVIHDAAHPLPSGDQTNW